MACHPTLLRFSARRRLITETRVGWMLRYVLTAMTLLGALQAVAGLMAVRWFAARRGGAKLCPSAAVTILKPVCGDEVLLEEAIASFCTQDYAGHVQLVIGAQDPADPALEVARRVQARFTGMDISIVVNSAWHGCNRKVANLMNMLPQARHDILVIADSDLHVQPDYLARVVETLNQPGCGLVTTACCGEPVARRLAPLLGASHMTHGFMPSALLGFLLGRQDCLGGTMALRRATLAQAGGLPALVHHLADDNVLGRLVRRQGLSVRLAPTMPVVVVQERQMRALWLHELRWARTIGALAPVAFACCLIQYPLLWAMLAVLLSGGAGWAFAGLLAAWGVRAAVASGIDHSLRGQRARPSLGATPWLLPARDVMSAAVLAASFWGDEVVWRGHVLHADRRAAQAPAMAIVDRAVPELVSFADDESLQA